MTDYIRIEIRSLLGSGSFTRLTVQLCLVMVPWGLTAVGSITAKEVLAAASLRCAWRASSRLQTMSISGANFASALKDSLSTKGRQEAGQ